MNTPSKPSVSYVDVMTVAYVTIWAVVASSMGNYSTAFVSILLAASLVLNAQQRILLDEIIDMARQEVNGWTELSDAVKALKPSAPTDQPPSQS